MTQPEAHVCGVLEIVPDGYGVLHAGQAVTAGINEKIHVAPSAVRMFALKTGDEIRGRAKPPSPISWYSQLTEIDSVNDHAPQTSGARAVFETLTPVDSTTRLTLETTRENLCGRIIDLLAPVGLGQHGLIVGPGGCGKSLIFENIANAVALNHSDIAVFVVLLDSSCEDAEATRRCLRNAAVFSTPGEAPANHVHLAELILARAKRLVENKVDVLILLDSLTTLVASYQAIAPAQHEPAADQAFLWGLEKAKQFFESSRKCKEGGSLTILATVDGGPGAAKDSLFQRVQGASDLQIVLDNKVFEEGIFPAVNIHFCGNRTGELIVSQEDWSRIWVLAGSFSLFRRQKQ